MLQGTFLGAVILRKWVLSFSCDFSTLQPLLNELCAQSLVTNTIIESKSIRQQSKLELGAGWLGRGQGDEADLQSWVL